MRKGLILSAAAAALLLGGCSFAPEMQTPNSELPQNFESPEQTGKSVSLTWWKAFNDPVLDALIDEALGHNSDLLLAASNVASARAALGIESASLYPQLNASAGLTQTNTSETTYGSYGDVTYDSYSASAVLSYEIDLWGKLRNARNAAESTLMAQEANRAAVRLALVAGVAESYFALVTMEQNVRVTKQALVSREETYAFRKKQYERGVVSELVLRQIEADLAGTRAQYAALQQQRALASTALAILVGRTPKAVIEGSFTLASTLPEAVEIPAVLPSDLMTRRPDIKAALAALESANFTIGSAKAAYFPSFSLTGSAGYASQTGGDLFDSASGIWGTGVAMNLSIFDFGRIRANIERAKVAKEASITQYDQVVRKAFGEVADALNKQRYGKAQLSALEAQVEALKQALHLAQKKFDAGYSDYLEVLDAQRSLLGAETARNTARQGVLSASISMYKALGGGWSEADLKSVTDGE